jgi:hypothetical protein
MEKLVIRAHQIPEIQRRLKDPTRSELETHGPEVENNANLIILQIKQNPEILIEISDKSSFICNPNCKTRAQLWHHCAGNEIRNYEKEEARRNGLKIGDRKPANQIFDF